jgi:hypothetical protein
VLRAPAGAVAGSDQLGRELAERGHGRGDDRLERGHLAADARHAPRPWRTSPPFAGLEAELPAGAAMDHPLFPVVWP